MNFIKYLVHSAVIILATGCTISDGPELPEDIRHLENFVVLDPDHTDLQAVQFEEEVRYKDTETNPIGRMAGFTADKQGRVFISDSDQMVIHVFDADGEYTGKIGRSGDGPGELRSFDSLIKTNGEVLFVNDATGRRIQLFSLDDFEFLQTIPLSNENRAGADALQGAHPAIFFPLQNGSLIMSFDKSQMIDEMNEQIRLFQGYLLFYHMDWDGNLRPDLLWERRDSRRFTFRMGGMMVGFTYPFLGRLIAASDGQTFYLGHTEEFLIEGYNTDGSYEKAFYYPFPRKTLSREEAILSTEDKIMQDIGRTIDLPETWPVLNEIVADDENRLWVSAIVEDDDIYEWWVLDESGKMIADSIGHGMNRLKW